MIKKNRIFFFHLISLTYLTASRVFDRSIKERFTFARSLASSSVLRLITRVRTRVDEMVCGTWKVHVVVDHGSGNSRSPAVVQVCMNVGSSSSPPAATAAAAKRRVVEKNAKQENKPGQVRFRSWDPCEFCALTATGNSKVHPQCIPPSRSPVLHYLRCTRARDVLQKGCRTPRGSLIVLHDHAIVCDLCDLIDRAIQ